VRLHRSVSEAMCPLPVTHHCGLPAAVKAGVGGRAAAHHAGVSVDTIIRAFSCRATERLSCTLSPCLRAPTAAGRAPGRSGAVDLANTALLPPSRLRGAPPPYVSNTIGEKSTPVRPHDSALSRHFCSPLSFRKVAALPGCHAGACRRQGSGGLWLGPPQDPASRPTLSAKCRLGGVRFRRCPPRGRAELVTG